MQAGGAGVLIVVAAKWFVAKSLDNAKELQALKEKSINDAIASVESILSEIKLEIVALKERIYHNEKIHVEGIGRLNLHSEKLANTVKAIEGFVKSVNDRFARVEKETSEVIKIGKEIALIRTKKSGGGNGS